MRHGLFRLRAMARRMVPYAIEDPNRLIGTCKYCDQDVKYAKGDLDEQGNARHDACELLAVRRQIAPPVADMLFWRALDLLRGMPHVKPRLLEAVRALPSKYVAVDMIGVLAAMTPHVESEPTLSLPVRHATIVALRDLRQQLAGLPSH